MLTLLNKRGQCHLPSRYYARIFSKRIFYSRDETSVAARMRPRLSAHTLLRRVSESPGENVLRSARARAIRYLRFTRSPISSRLRTRSGSRPRLRPLERASEPLARSLARFDARQPSERDSILRSRRVAREADGTATANAKLSDFARSRKYPRNSFPRDT